MKLSEDQIISIVRHSLCSASAKKYIGFQLFPNGACNDASILLGKLLEEYGNSTYQVCYGKSEEGTHSWLYTPNRIIDITIDQFMVTDPKQFVFEHVQEPNRHLGFTANQQMSIPEAIKTVRDVNFLIVLSEIMSIIVEEAKQKAK